MVDHQDAVGADAEVPIAQARGPLGAQPLGQLVAVDHHEVVAAALHLEEREGRHVDLRSGRWR